MSPEAAALGMIAGLATLLRIQHLSTISFWFDEACSWKISQFPISELMDAVRRDAHPPLYYLLMKAWISVFGHLPVVGRWFSVLLGVCSVVVTWSLVSFAIKSGRDSTFRALPPIEQAVLPLLAAMLMALSVIQVEMSQEARPYALGTFLAIGAGAFALRVVNDPSHALCWIGFALCALTLSYTHYYGLFTVSALFLFLGVEAIIAFCRTGWNSASRRLLIGTLGCGWLIQLSWLPWFSTFFYQRQRADAQLWQAPLNWSGISATCWQVLAGGKSSDIPDEWAWITVAFWLFLALILLRVGGPSGRLAGLGAIAPLLGVVGYGYFVRNIIGVRYLIFADAYLLIGCVVMLGAIRIRALRLILGIGLLAWSGFWAWRHSELREFQASFPGTQGAVAYLNENRERSEPVIVSSPFIHTIAWHYLLHQGGVFVQYHGDHRANVLDGPPLRAIECWDTSSIELTSQVLWTVDAEGLFGSRSDVIVPKSHLIIFERRFPEHFGFRMDLIVRKYASATEAVGDIRLREAADILK